jgi:hypothetical protein
VTFHSRRSCGASEDIVPRHLQNVSFFEGIPSFDNPDNVPTLFC